MIQALEKSLGIVTTACKSVGIDRGTHYDWYRDDPDYRAKVDELDNIALDFAESQLHKQMKDGVPSSTIFFLKTKGRKRGYREKTLDEELEQPQESKSESIIDLGNGAIFKL